MSRASAFAQTRKFFVYGTLKRFHRNNGLLARAAFLGTFRTSRPDFTMCGADFPVVRRARSSGKGAFVEGELYELAVDDLRTLHAIDRLECNGRLYIREVVEIGDPSGSKAWMYLGLRGLPRSPRVSPSRENVLSWSGR